MGRAGARFLPCLSFRLTCGKTLSGRCVVIHCIDIVDLHQARARQIPPYHRETKPPAKCQIGPAPSAWLRPGADRVPARPVEPDRGRLAQACPRWSCAPPATPRPSHRPRQRPPLGDDRPRGTPEAGRPRYPRHRPRRHARRETTRRSSASGRAGKAATTKQTATFPGRPKSPGSNYRTTKESRLLGWLTSANAATPTTLPAVTQSATTVTLVGKGSVGTGADRDKLQVHLTPPPSTTGKQPKRHHGVVGRRREPEGPRAASRTPPPRTPPPGWAVLAKSHAVADPKRSASTPLLDDPAPAEKAITRSQTDLMQPTKTPLARVLPRPLGRLVGLLTNTATGGWRKDLSLLSEKWDAQAQTGTSLLPRDSPDPVRGQARRPSPRRAP